MMFQAVTRFFASVALSLFVVSSSYATPASDLSSLLGNIKTLRANFTQTIYDNHNQAAQVSYGKMALKRPGQFRWEVKKPMAQLIVANQSRLWIYDPDLDQVTIRALNQAAGDTPALLLSHENVRLEKDYVVKPSNVKGSNLQWFLLSPKKEDSLFESVQMGFKNGNIQEMRLIDHLGHTTAIQFKQAEFNKDLPDTLFVFKAPKGVDVIDETRQQ